MSKRAQYRTKQMEELLSYLKSVKGVHITVKDICSHFQDEGITVGVTTIYRHLDRMVKEGLVAKYVIEGTDSACFEYIGEHENCKKPVCYHCKCEKCGKLIHLQCDEIESLGLHMLENHGFEVNSQRTVFYGICKDCIENDK